MMKPELERILPIKVVGYFPNDDRVHIGSRHLGLMTAAEIQNLDEVIQSLGAMAEESIDLDLLLRLGEEAEALPAVPVPGVGVEAGEPASVAQSQSGQNRPAWRTGRPWAHRLIRRRPLFPGR